jgi:hypothetical protein
MIIITKQKQATKTKAKQDIFGADLGITFIFFIY